MNMDYVDSNAYRRKKSWALSVICYRAQCSFHLTDTQVSSAIVRFSALGMSAFIKINLYVIKMHILRSDGFEVGCVNAQNL